MSTLRVSTLQNAASSTANVTLDASGNATVGGTLAMGSSFLRNCIINGGMSFWQRATTYTATPSSVPLYGSVDRWAFYSGSSMTASQSTSVPSGFQYSLRVQRPNGATTTSQIFALQVVESVNMLALAGQTVTLSFFARAGTNFSAAGSVLGVGVNTGTVADQGSASSLGGWTGSTIPLNSSPAITTTWTRYTVTGVIPANALELSAYFYYTPSGTAGADDSFYITGVQLEVGSVATPFERRQYGTELMLCQRYYQTIFNGAAGFVDSATKVVIGVVYPVAMRSAPSGALGGTTVQVATSAGAQNAVGATIDDSTYYVGSCQVRVTGYTGLTTGQGAIMRSGNGVTFLLLSAEL